MAEKNIKVGDPIKIVYQAPNAQSGLDNIVAEIYLPGDIKDSDFPDITLTEIDSTGEYVGAFTPNQQGEWVVIIHKPGGEGQVVKRYSVGAHNVHSVGDVVSNIDDVVADIDSDVALVDDKVDIVNEKATSIETKVDSIDTKVSFLDTPPMVS